jgi:uncharacterized membrane protein YphA (DoxX/SURF4 family)
VVAIDRRVAGTIPPMAGDVQIESRGHPARPGGREQSSFVSCKVDKPEDRDEQSSRLTSQVTRSRHEREVRPMDAVKSRKVARIAGLVLHVLIGALLIFAGSFKVSGFGGKELVEMMSKYGLGDKIVLIGAGELIAGVLLIVPMTSKLGALVTSGFWGGVICIHMAHGESYVSGIVSLLLTWLGAYLRYPEMFVGGPRSETPVVKVQAEL